MKIRPIKIQNMNDQYLLALLRTGNVKQYSKVVNEIKKRLSNKRLSFLLYKWSEEKNETLKELFEIAIANKISDFFPIMSYNELPKTVKKYLEKVSSIEAISILMNSNIQSISNKSQEKYFDFLDAYLEATEERDLDLYKTEGDDTSIIEQKETKIIPFPKKQEKVNDIIKKLSP